MKEEDEDDDLIVKKKITIVGEGYQLKQVSDSSHLWNLYLKRKRKKKDGTEEEKYVIDSYGIVIRQAIPKISNFLIAQNLNGKAVTLRQYLQLWLKVSNKILKELKGL